MAVDTLDRPRALTETVIETLIEAAVLAPSGDNLQPWRFEVDAAAGRITVIVDETKDRSPMNAGQRMSRIAVGAAVENMARTAVHNGLRVDVEYAPQSEVTLHVSGKTPAEMRVEPVIRQRCTNRRIYRGTSPADHDVASLRAALSEDSDVSVVWITERNDVDRLARVIACCDSLMFGNPHFRSGFFKSVRFDLPAGEPAVHGLSLDSLEVHGLQRSGFRQIGRLPAWAASLMRVGAMIGAQSERLVRSAGGLCLGFARDHECTTDFKVGRTMQQAWLAITRQGLSAQPMMSLPVHESAGRFRPDLRLTTRAIANIESAGRELRKFAGEGMRPAFLLRFGDAEPPTGRCGRMQSVTNEANP